MEGSVPLRDLLKLLKMNCRIIGERIVPVVIATLSSSAAVSEGKQRLRG